MLVELSTIPVYLSVWFSMKPGSNPYYAAKFRDIVGQEMVHLNLAANLIMALGGRPELATKESA
jgi:hypothetical protein